MPRNIDDLVKSLERVRELSFKAAIAETELETKDWNMRIHQEVSKTLDGPPSTRGKGKGKVNVQKLGRHI